jgi:hypothetical protein
VFVKEAAVFVMIGLEKSKYLSVAEDTRFRAERHRSGTENQETRSQRTEGVVILQRAGFFAAAFVNDYRLGDQKGIIYDKPV